MRILFDIVGYFLLILFLYFLFVVCRRSVSVLKDFGKSENEATLSETKSFLHLMEKIEKLEQKQNEDKKSLLNVTRKIK